MERIIYELPQVQDAAVIGKDRCDAIVSERGTTSADPGHAILSTFYAWAIDKDHVAGANPTADIKHLKAS